MKFFPLFFILFFNTTYSQVHLRYPEGQDSYKGGLTQMYKEMKEVLLKNNPQGCENKNEVLAIKVLVDENEKIKLVYEPDTTAINNNKCAFDLAKNTLKFTSNWQAATVDGKKVKAITRFIFAPNDIINGSFPDGQSNVAEFPGGINNYREKFMRCFDVRGYTYSDDVRFVMNFEINTLGEIQNIFIDTKIDNQSFLDMVTNCVKGPKKIKWKPAEYKGTPFVSQFKLPISIKQY